MESIVKMGVSGKNTYGKNEQRDGAAGADPYSAQEAGLYQDLNGADAGESKSAVSAAASSAGISPSAASPSPSGSASSPVISSSA